VVETIAGRLRGTEIVMAADFRGLTVKQLAELRGRLRDAESELTVVKNTLARRAAVGSGREGLVALLDGPSGLVWVGGDPARAAKALSDFAREHPDRFAVKGGLLGAVVLPRESIGRLATLPSREVLLAQLAGGIAAPLSGLATRLSALIGGLARVLAAVQEQRAEPAPAEAAPAAAAPVEEAPAEEAAVEEAPAEEAAIEAPVETPAAEAPAAEAPAAEAPAAEAPAAEAPADEAPADEAASAE
jgi:large subunit ribosomal protein L10